MSDCFPAHRASRRRFIQAAAAVACSPVLGAMAIEPIGRTAAKFKYSLAAYSYRRLLQGEPPRMSLYDFVDDCARFQLEGTELTSYYFPKDVTREDLRRLKRHCFRQGLDVSGTAVGNDFGHPPGEQRTAQLESVRTWIERAAVLGAPVIRIFAGSRHGDLSPEATHELVVQGIDESCRYAGEHGVHLALENHGGPTATAEGLLRIVRDVSSPWFGVNLDTGNFHSNDVYADLAAVAPYALNVQVKVVTSGPEGNKQPTDFTRLAQLLRQSNYRGYVVLEFEEDGDPRQECPRYLAEIRRSMDA